MPNTGPFNPYSPWKVTPKTILSPGNVLWDRSTPSQPWMVVATECTGRGVRVEMGVSPSGALQIVSRVIPYEAELLFVAERVGNLAYRRFCLDYLGGRYRPSCTSLPTEGDKSPSVSGHKCLYPTPLPHSVCT